MIEKKKQSKLRTVFCRSQTYKIASFDHMMNFFLLFFLNLLGRIDLGRMALLQNFSFWNIALTTYLTK